MSESWNEIYPRVNAMFYMNIRSLSKHYDELQMLLLQNQFQMLTVCLTETWLKNENVNLYNLPGYNSVNNYRMKKPGGGVTIMIREDLPFNYIDQLTYIDHNIESIGVKLEKNPPFFTRDTIICCIYRPPQGDIKEFAKKFNQILEKVSKNKTYIFGDFNIDLKKKSEHSEILLNSGFSFGFFPLISKPTRVYKYSQTIIDNIFTNSYNTILNHYILESGISDHYPLILTTQNGEQEKSEVTLQRKITKKNIDSFIRTVNSQNFTDILHMKSSCEAYSKLHQILTDAYNKSFPLTKPRSTYKQRLPWVDGQLQNLIKRKNKMYLKSRKCPTIENQQIYKKN